MSAVVMICLMEGCALDEKHVGPCENLRSFDDAYAAFRAIRSKLAKVEEERDAAESGAAAMRAVLEMVFLNEGVHTHNDMARVRRAIALDVGKNHVHRAELEKVQAEAALMRPIVQAALDWVTDLDGCHFCSLRGNVADRHDEECPLAGFKMPG